MSDTPTLTEAVRDGLLDHEWTPGFNFSPYTAHRNHDFEGSCALCQGDAERIAALALEIAGEQPPTQWAYDRACGALEKQRQRADAAEAALARARSALAAEIDDMDPDHTMRTGLTEHTGDQGHPGNAWWRAYCEVGGMLRALACIDEARGTNE
ncbi:hypothetical protein GCM10023224_05270 [Streptomonospora halophila]|uniref:Uncharacterized protein n=1 Tax=Streptomonospora halophila TaxID=427369 RepID=A0ABP9G6T9_9ACTN